MNRQLRVLSPLFLIASSALLLRCGQNSQGQAREAVAERPPVAVETQRVSPADFAEAVDVVGTLSPKQDAFVKAEHAGPVAEVYVTEWVHVSKGTPLAKLDTRENEAAVAAAQAAVLQADAQAIRAARELERAVNLKQAGLITQQAVDDARTSVNAFEAGLDAARAQLSAARTRLEKSTIRSPMDGVVAMRAVSVGDLASGDPIFRVVDPRVFDLKATVPSGRISLIKTGQDLVFSTDAVPGREFSGKVAFINPSADPASRTVQVVAEVPNPDGVLRAGSFVKGRIVTSFRPNILQVPRGAVLNWDMGTGAADVFVVEGDKARRGPIRTGATSEDAVEVLSGLKDGDRVVTRGAFLLQDGDRVAESAAAPAKAEKEGA